MSIRKDRFPLRLKLAVAVAALAVVAVAAFVLNRSTRASLAEAPKANFTQVSALPPAAFVPVGVPVGLLNLSAETVRMGKENFEFISKLKARVVTTGNDSLDGLNLMVFEFDAGGALRCVDGFALPVDLSAGRPVEIALPVERRAVSGNRLVLAVERANGQSRGWEANATDVARGAAAIAVNVTPPGQGAREGASVQPDAGAALCSNGFRRAMSLAQLGDRAGVTSFTCDQQERSFSFTFQAKKVI